MIVSVNIKPRIGRKNAWTAYVWTKGKDDIPNRHVLRGDLYSIMKKVQEISDSDV